MGKIITNISGVTSVLSNPIGQVNIIMTPIQLPYVQFKIVYVKCPARCLPQSWCQKLLVSFFTIPSLILAQIGQLPNGDTFRQRGISFLDFPDTSLQLVSGELQYFFLLQTQYFTYWHFSWCLERRQETQAGHFWASVTLKERRLSSFQGLCDSSVPPQPSGGALGETSPLHAWDAQEWAGSAEGGFHLGLVPHQSINSLGTELQCSDRNWAPQHLTKNGGTAQKAKDTSSNQGMYQRT